MPRVPTFPIEACASLLRELALEPEQARIFDLEEPRSRAAVTSLLVGPLPETPEVEAFARELHLRADRALSEEGALLLGLQGEPDDRKLARWRNALWPWLHVFAILRVSERGAVRETLQGRGAFDPAGAPPATWLAARRREHVLSPAATIAKFDQNAGGWDFAPGTPGHAHFRWMRRYVAQFTTRRDYARILDFGCGAGWVGIEAALRAPGAALCAFDPSPEMVELARENARSEGIARFEARTGFGEEPPFPAQGEPRFDLVLSSGVVSFAPGLERWILGLARTVAPLGTLVVGDVNRESRGMRARRRTRPLLPARELNALTRSEMRALLEKLSFEHEASAGYQLTWPVPQAMHASDTRLRGGLTPPFVALNRMCAGDVLPESAFDSWVMRLRAPA